MDMDPGRLALVRTGDPGGCGSGYLIGPQLVLTALHVVRPEGRWAGRVEARVGHPRYGAGPVDRRAQVCWPDPRRDVPPADALDVALLWLDEPVDTGGEPVRWGRPGGVVPVPFEGAGFPAFAADAGSPAQFEYLRGELPDVSTSLSGWVLNCPVWPAPGRGKERPWEGASGSAIFCHGRLVGVVAEDNQTMGYRRLHAAPVHEALSLPSFADLVTKRGYPGTTTTLEEVTAQTKPGKDGVRELALGIDELARGDYERAARLLQHAADLQESGDVRQQGSSDVHYYLALAWLRGSGPRAQTTERLRAVLHGTRRALEAAPGSPHAAALLAILAEAGHLPYGRSVADPPLNRLRELAAHCAPEHAAELHVHCPAPDSPTWHHLIRLIPPTEASR